MPIHLNASHCKSLLLNDIKRGFVFKGPFPNGSDKNHYCIALNEISDDSDLIYFYMTSQKVKVKRIYRNDIDALVEINQNDYDPLHKDTFIQCGERHLCKLKLDDLAELFSKGQIDIKETISDAIIQKIEDAIINGKTYSEHQRKELFNL